MKSGGVSGNALAMLALGAGLIAVLALPFILRPPRSDESLAKPERRSVLPARKLTIISPHWEGIRAEFGRAFSEFTAARLGHETEIEWLDVGGTSDAVRYVRSQFARFPDGINVDIFFGGGVDPYLQLVEAGLLGRCEISGEVLDRIPRSFAGLDVYDGEHRWFGAALSGFGIVYNKKVCRTLRLPVPETWEDLCDPRFFGWVGSGDSRSSGSVHMVYEIMLQAYGWERGWAAIVGMCGNTRNFSRAASSIPKDAAVGEVACGMAIDVYGWRQIAEVGSDRMGFCLPASVTVINPDGIGVLKGAPDRELACRFVEFVLSEDGQMLWCLKAGEPGGPKQYNLARIPVIPGFIARFPGRVAVDYDPFTMWKGSFVYDAQKASSRWSILNDLLGMTVIDTHSELASAWKAVKSLPAEDGRRRDLLGPPYSEQELLDLAKDQWQNPEFRARTCGRWASESKARYARIAGR